MRMYVIISSSPTNSSLAPFPFPSLIWFFFLRSRLLGAPGSLRPEGRVARRRAPPLRGGARRRAPRAELRECRRRQVHSAELCERGWRASHAMLGRRRRDKAATEWRSEVAAAERCGWQLGGGGTTFFLFFFFLDAKNFTKLFSQFFFIFYGKVLQNIFT